MRKSPILLVKPKAFSKTTYKINVLFLTIIIISLFTSSCKKNNNSPVQNSKDTTISIIVNNVGDPHGIAVDNEGNIIVANQVYDNILNVTPSGSVSVIAGNGVDGYSDGPNASAEFFQPTGVVIDKQGDIIVVDRMNNRIRKISNGMVVTFAGRGSTGTTGGFSDGDASTAMFSLPRSIVMDKQGNFIVSDNVNNLIRKITPDGLVSTIAGIPLHAAGDQDGDITSATFDEPTGVALDAQGNIYVVDYNSSKIRKINMNTNTVTTIAGGGGIGYADGEATVSKFFQPTGITVDAEGNVIVADTYNNKLRKITPAGITSTFPGSYNMASDVKIDNEGNIIVAEEGGHRILKVTVK